MDFLNNNFISDFFLLLLKGVYSIMHDYSVAIIVVTVLMRLAMLPLDLRQKKSMRKMQMIQPMITSLKKRYSNNPQQLQKKTQELYRKEGVKPLAGCLPMLITLPIFFAFFGAMRILAAQETVSFILDNAHSYGSAALPQWLWVHNFWQPDSGIEPILPSAVNFLSFVQTNTTYITPQAMHMLSNANLINFDYVNGILSATNAAGTSAVPAYDSLVNKVLTDNNVLGYNNGWFILPVLAGATLFIQQKITMKQNPQQQQQQGGAFMLWFFPIFSIFICATSNAAFSVYWLIANVYALAQILVLNYIYKMREKKEKGIIEEAP